MGAPSKRAKKIRVASDFDLVRISSELRSPRSTSTAYSWALADIVSARNEQMMGRFRLPARLAESMRTDDALAVAYENRLAPQRCIPVEIKPARDNALAKKIAAEAEALFGPGGVGIHPDTLADINGCLVDHGVAFGILVATPREDGSRVDVELKVWPIEFVRWDPLDRCFKAQVDPMGQPAVIPGPVKVEGEVQAYQSINVWEEPIVHGDGRWVVFQKHSLYPFRQEAALLPASMVWARHAFAVRDWAKGSVAHGSAKVIGEMPTGMALQNKDGLTPEAKAFLTLLQQIGSGDAPVGIRPAGAKTEFLTNTSSAWQVWSELVLNAEKAAARIYLGTDGVLGSQGGAPGVDVQALFGVADTKVEGDLKCIERAIDSGVIQVWTAINFGDSTLAPCRRYLVPDGRGAALKKSLGERTAAFSAALKGMHDAGLAVTQEYSDQLADAFNVPAPRIVSAAPAAAAPSAPGTAAPIAPALRRV
jgi:hypothetical protein